MVFAAVDGRSMWSALGETPLITASPAVAARTRQKWTDGAVIGPDGAGALVEIKAVLASKPVDMRSVAADLAPLAAVDWPDTLGWPGVTLVLMSIDGRTAIGSPSYGLYASRWCTARHRQWKTPRPGCQLS